MPHTSHHQCLTVTPHVDWTAPTKRPLHSNLVIDHKITSKMATSFRYVVTAVALSLMISCCRAETYAVPFGSCHADIPAPSSLRLECSRLDGDTCELDRGISHSAIVQFTPAHSSSRVRSSLMKNTRVPIAMRGQDLEGCGDHMSCPLTPGALTTFTHSVNINRHCMTRRYSLVWRLVDRDTNEAILCFIFKARIV